ncbi:hypothetical protein AN920_07670 [Pseudomonas paraeruginosa]|nr:hypothetical protein AN920_07670 [Pseudomonas paraeruginosa]
MNEAGRHEVFPGRVCRAPRQRQTEAERALWLCLHGQRLLGLKFRRQNILGPYIVDFRCHERMLVIALDGGQHEDSPADRLRDAWLERRAARRNLLLVL